MKCILEKYIILMSEKSSTQGFVLFENSGWHGEFKNGKLFEMESPFTMKKLNDILTR
ncbi:unnamed protein product, partial [marine sediment metagenome]